MICVAGIRHLSQPALLLHIIFETDDKHRPKLLTSQFILKRLS